MLKFLPQQCSEPFVPSPTPRSDLAHIGSLPQSATRLRVALCWGGEAQQKAGEVEEAGRTFFLVEMLANASLKHL